MRRGFRQYDDVPAKCLLLGLHISLNVQNCKSFNYCYYFPAQEGNLTFNGRRERQPITA